MRLSLKVFAIVCMSAFVLVQFFMISSLSGSSKYPWEQEEHDFRAIYKRTTTTEDREHLDQSKQSTDSETSNNMQVHVPPQQISPNNLSKQAKNDKDVSDQSMPYTKPVSVPDLAPAPVVPICEPKGKDAISALERAKSSECKQKIRDIICLSQADLVYNTSLKNECPIGKNPAKQFKFIPYNEGKGPGIRIVFLLSIHGRAVREVKRLFKAVYHVDHYYYIHVDYHSDYLYEELKIAFKQYPNVYFPDWRMATIWGGASLLQMLLKALEELEFKLTYWKWDYFINLSESDYPLRTNEELVQFLRAQRKFNFVKTHGGDIKKFIQKQGLDRTFVECDYHMWRIGNRPLPPDITIDGGSDWIVINRNYSHYLTTNKSPFINGLKKYYEYSLLPAESFFHTVLRNGPMCDTLVRSNLRVTNWNRKLGCRCQYKHIVDWCGCSPNNFLKKDLDKIKNPKDDQFFARKFEAIVNQHVIRELDGHLYGHYPEDTPSLNSYWESLYHYQYDSKPSSDAHYTVYQSFMRITKNFVSNTWNQSVAGGNEHQSVTDCSLPDKLRVNEVFVHHHDDQFVGLVARFEDEERVTTSDGIGQGGGGVYETLFIPIQHQVLGESDSCPKMRGTIVEVGSNWDGKESIFRNYGSILGVNDQPTIALKQKVGRMCQLDVTWINPLGIVDQKSELKLEPGSTVNSHKLNSEAPLMPGKWAVRIMAADELFIEKHFTVFPVMFDKSGAPLEQPSLVNAKRITILKPNMDKERYMEWRTNILKSGDKLQEWIDTLALEQWQIKSTCSGVHSPGSSASSGTSNNCKSLPSCKVSSWSSYYPDTKSELGHPNDRGRIR